MLALFGLFSSEIFFELLIVLPISGSSTKSLDPSLTGCSGPSDPREPVALLAERVRLLKARELKGKPFDGSCVVVSNHPGLFDVLFLIRDVPRMSVMVKQSLARKLPSARSFAQPGMSSPPTSPEGPFQCLDEAI